MSKINLGQTIQILANLGVIAGIVFLGIQLQQNNALLAAQARASRAQVRIDGLQAAASNQELLSASVKQRSGEPLTATEVLLLDLDAIRVLATWQYVWGEYRAGLIEESDVPIENWRFAYSQRPAMKPLLENTERSGLRPDFAQWMQENVVK